MRRLVSQQISSPPATPDRGGAKATEGAGGWWARLRLPNLWRPDRVALGSLLVCGVALRVVAVLSWWPVNPVLADSWPYAYYAGTNPLADPQHPAGYASFLAVVGVFTRDVAVPILLQHLLGIVAALLIYFAVKRLVGSPWAALVPAAVVLLDSDELFLEQTIMAESLYVFFMCATLYASVRALDRPSKLWPWPIVAMSLAVASAIIRTQGLFYLPVLVIALWFAQRGPMRKRWRVPVAVTLFGWALLGAYACGNLASNDRFEVSPATGWHLYARVAPFAQCQYFTPPKGTRVLCDPRPPAVRFGSDWYLYTPQSPALKYFGPLGNHDSTLRAFAIAAILGEPKEYLRVTFHELEGYFVPSLHPYLYGGGCGISCQVDWQFGLEPNPPTEAKTIRGMETFFSRFTVHKSRSELEFLDSYQHRFGFGATLLVVTSLLTLLGLFIGSRRERLGVFLFGVGGLAMLIFPTFGVYFLGRYMVPIAGPMAASGAICILSIVRLEKRRRLAETGIAADA